MNFTNWMQFQGKKEVKSCGTSTKILPTYNNLESKNLPNLYGLVSFKEQKKQLQETIRQTLKSTNERRSAQVLAQTHKISKFYGAAILLTD